MKKRVLLLSLMVAGALSASAQVSLTGSNPSYSQDFNTLATSGNNNNIFSGWVLSELGTSVQANNQYGANDGSSNTGNIYSYGTGTNAERALGALQSSSLAPKWGATFLNNTGQSITNVAVSFKGEQWRRGNITAGSRDTIVCHVSIDADSLNDVTATWIPVASLTFVSQNTTAAPSAGTALDGNLAANSLTLTASSPVSVPNGGKLWIRWTDRNIQGTDDGLAIDDFQATFTTTGGGTPDTLVRFSPTAATVAENAGSQNLSVTYVPTSPTSSFTAQVVLKSGNAADIGNYTTQTATFAANTNTTTVPVSITNNGIVDGTKTFVFALRNPSGAMLVGVDSLFTLTVTDDEAPVPTIPVYPIALVRGTNANGQPDSLGTVCEVRGTVYGINTRAAGLQFTIHDGTAGIGVFTPANTFGYTVQEGDSIHVRGEVAVFRGLAQMSFVDTIIKVTTPGNVEDPTFVTALNEGTESDLVRIQNCTLVNASQWTGNVNGFNVDITNGSTTFQMRVERNTTAITMPAPTGMFAVIGLGSQFATTTAAPFTNGYQIVPRKKEDILLGGSISENEASSKLSVFPNPTSGQFTVSFESAAAGNAVVALKDLTGRTVMTKNMVLGNGTNQINIDEQLSAGVYLVTIQMGGVKAVKRVVVR